MAVEAQLCPQCGAAIQFIEKRTEAVCAYCGTTVVSSTVLSIQGEPLVGKELAAEKLIQEMVRQENKLHAHGQPAIGKIIVAKVTDIFRETIEGRAVLMVFELEVQPDGDAIFTATANALIGLSAVDKYQVGTFLDVYYDPQALTQVAIIGRHGVHNNNPIVDEDWKQRVVNWAANEFRKEQGIDLRQDRQAMQRLHQAVETAKNELTSLTETDINLPFITADSNGPKHLNLHLSRTKFDEITRDLLDH